MGHRMLAMTTVVCFVVVLGGLTIASPPVAAQSADPIFDPGDPGDGEGTGERPCGEDLPPTMACAVSAVCVDIAATAECAGVDTIPGTCVPETGSHGVAVLVCLIPAPDPPNPVGTMLVDSTPVACDAEAPPPSLDTAVLPTVEIGASPPGLYDWHGIPGMESWFWAEGPTAAAWRVAGDGTEGVDWVYQPVVLDADGVAVPSGPPFTIEQRWPCIVVAVYVADVVAYDWQLTSDRRDYSFTAEHAGSRPDPAGSGSVAAWRIDPDTHDHHVVSVTPIWQGRWDDAPTGPGPSSARDHVVREVRAYFHERR